VQLVQFQRRRQRIALVVDEYGDIQGIITLEDILEEIVGEFATDPGNVGDDIINEGDGTFLIDGAANIREINRTQDWHLPTEGPKTINGLILEALETIPDSNISLKIAGYPIEIVETDGNRIRSVRIGPRTTKHDQSI
jgi:Mg2+/Co2+ transporter CorB